MKVGQLATLRFFTLLVFVLPGLAGMVVSAVISLHYLGTLPRWPTPEQMRMTPRNIHGTVVYQTVEEDRKLGLIEDFSVGAFLIGLVSGELYLAKSRKARARATEEEDSVSEDYS
jgi:hypothetical protein